MTWADVPVYTATASAPPESLLCMACSGADTARVETPAGLCRTHDRPDIREASHTTEGRSTRNGWNGMVRVKTVSHGNPELTWNDGVGRSKQYLKHRLTHTRSPPPPPREP